MPDGARQNPCRELLLLGVLAALWGSSYLLIKVAVATIPPLTLIAIRVTLADRSDQSSRSTAPLATSATGAGLPVRPCHATAASSPSI
jgi:hypothetical protein